MKKRRSNGQIKSLVTGIFFALFSCAKISPTYSTRTDQPVLGHVQQQDQYCGGARLPQEKLDEITRVKPFPNKTFYVRSGSINTLESKVVASFTTDQQGRFSITLPPGIYSIILEEQLNTIDYELYRGKNQQVDEKCLAEWWKKPYYVLTVPPSTPPDPLRFLFIHRCHLTTDIPCITYSGPFTH